MYNNGMVASTFIAQLPCELKNWSKNSGFFFSIFVSCSFCILHIFEMSKPQNVFLFRRSYRRQLKMIPSMRRSIPEQFFFREGVHASISYVIQEKQRVFGQNQAFLVSLAVSFEVERRMIAQNDPLDEAVHPRTKFSFGRGSTRQFFTLSRKNSGFSAKIKLFW